MYNLDAPSSNLTQKIRDTKILQNSATFRRFTRQYLILRSVRTCYVITMSGNACSTSPQLEQTSQAQGMQERAIVLIRVVQDRIRRKVLARATSTISLQLRREMLAIIARVDKS